VTDGVSILHIALKFCHLWCALKDVRKQYYLYE